MKPFIQINSIYTTYILLAAIAVPLAGCDSAPPPQTVYLQASRLNDPPPPVVKEIPVPVAIPQWRQVPATQPATTQPASQVIQTAVQSATQRPSQGAFIEAIQTYDYVPGMVYQVIASPGHVTTILLQPGEQLLAKACGDTAQWLIGDTNSGSGDDARTLVLIKPLKPELQTNLVLSTSQRVYQIDLQSLAGVYHSAVQWTYPADFARQLAEDQRQQNRDTEAMIERAVNLADLDFGYSIHAQGDTPDWMPLRVFSDGHKTYITFPKDLDAKEAPPLFVLSQKGDAQLVNYRQRGNYYVVDQVIAKAELRLGESPQQVVRIQRDGM